MHLLILPGDGIGPEISAATADVMAAAGIAGLPVRFSHAGIGFASLAAHGTTFTDAVFAQAQAADGVVLRPVSDNEHPPPDRVVAVPEHRTRDLGAAGHAGLCGAGVEALGG